VNQDVDSKEPRVPPVVRSRL